MAVHKIVDLECDECGALLDDPSGYVAGVRATARSSGWKYRNGRDICDKCSNPFGVFGDE